MGQKSLEAIQILSQLMGAYNEFHSHRVNATEVNFSACILFDKQY